MSDIYDDFKMKKNLCCLRLYIIFQRFKGYCIKCRLRQTVNIP